MKTVALLSLNHRIEPPKTDALLGLCDPEGEQPAYSTSTKDGPDKWAATVENKKNKPVQFVPIDKNIKVYRANGDLESTCDGMLLFDNDKSIYLVELKDVSVPGWAATALEQVVSTIQIFLANYDYRDFGRRRAYLANRRHPWFHVSYRSRLQEFKNKYHFQLYPQAEIVID